MMQAMLAGVAAKLQAYYKEPRYHIYGQGLPANREAPYFLLLPLSVHQSTGLSGRYRQDYALKILYIGTMQEKQSLSTVMIADSLFDLLDQAQVQGQWFLGNGLYYEIRAGVVHFYVNYRVYLQKEEIQWENERQSEKKK